MTHKRVTTHEFFIYHLGVRNKLLTYEEASEQDVVDYIHRGMSISRMDLYGLVYHRTRG